MNIKKSIVFYRSSETGKVDCATAIYPEGAELSPFDVPYLWKSNILTCGTPEAQEFLLAVADKWNDKHNKQFKLPVHLGDGVTVTYEECEFMMCSLYGLMQMSDEEAAQSLTEVSEDAQPEK